MAYSLIVNAAGASMEGNVNLARVSNHLTPCRDVEEPNVVHEVELTTPRDRKCGLVKGGEGSGDQRP
jgi:hypothetical protein